ncbi:MAG: tetratricopeptide repeat protein [Chloroflexota bacterium]
MTNQTDLLKRVRIALQTENYLDAIANLEKVVNIARDNNDVSAQGRHLGNLALTYFRIGDIKQALKHFEDALICARSEQDRMMENGLLGNMGNVLREAGRYDDAIDRLNDALLLAQELGDRRGRGIWLSNLGLVYDDLNRPKEAIPVHKSSVKVARQLYDNPSLATRLGNLGNAYIADNKYTEAIEQFKEAVTIYEQLGRKDEVALRVGIIGNLYAEMGRAILDSNQPQAYVHLNVALDYYGRAMTLMRELGDKASEAEVIRRIGNVLADADQLEDATKYLNVAQQMFEALGLQQQAEHSATTLRRIIEFLESDPSS